MHVSSSISPSVLQFRFICVIMLAQRYDYIISEQQEEEKVTYSHVIDCIIHDVNPSFKGSNLKKCQVCIANIVEVD